MSRRRPNSKRPRGCGICGGTNGERVLAADHCHQTKRERGFLCTRCNMGLGYFRDNPALLWEAIKYISGSEYIVQRLQDAAADATPWPKPILEAIAFLADWV